MHVSASLRYSLFCTLFYCSQIGTVYNNFDHISVTGFFFRVPQPFRNDLILERNWLLVAHEIK